MTDQEKTLHGFGRQWDASILSNDVSKISAFMDDDRVIVGSEGGITAKSDFLLAIKSGDLFHSTMDFEDLHIKIRGDTGVVVSRGTSAGTFKGIAFSFYEWSTSTYVRVNNRWKCITTMLTPAH